MPNSMRQSEQAPTRPYCYNSFAMFWHPHAPAACMLPGTL